jgi:ATP-binding cassette subfamily F protein uup
MGYLQDFLFTPERARQPVSALSGGEQNRLLLAKLFAKPANLLVMDEPTNDLDLETLELLEELLLNYEGTLLLVSHDRTFLDSVVTGILAFEDQGLVREYVGGYQDWIRQGGRFPTPEKSPARLKTAGKVAATHEAPGIEEKKPARKLSYKLQRELELLPGEIETLESQIAELETTLSHPDFYQQDADKVAKTVQQMEKLQQGLEEKMQRWMELEAD